MNFAADCWKRRSRAEPMFHEPGSPKPEVLVLKLPVIATTLFGNGHLSCCPRSIRGANLPPFIHIVVQFGWQFICRKAMMRMVNEPRTPNPEPRVLIIAPRKMP